MNQLAQLISDLNLDETLVMKRLQHNGLVAPHVLAAEAVPENDCSECVRVVMAVLRFQEKYPRPCGQSA